MKNWIILILAILFLGLIVYGVTQEMRGREVTATAPAETTSSSTSSTLSTSTTSTTLALNESNDSEVSGAATRVLSPHEQCLGKFVALKKESIIFRFAPWSSFSAEWEPTVQKVEGLGYPVARAQVGDETKDSFFENEDFIEECFKEAYKPKTVPQFICAGTKDQFIGIEANVYTLREFAESCKQAAAKTEAAKPVPDAV